MAHGGRSGLTCEALRRRHGHPHSIRIVVEKVLTVKVELMAAVNLVGTSKGSSKAAASLFGLCSSTVPFFEPRNFDFVPFCETRNFPRRAFGKSEPKANQQRERDASSLGT